MARPTSPLWPRSQARSWRLPRRRGSCQWACCPFKAQRIWRMWVNHPRMLGNTKISQNKTLIILPFLDQTAFLTCCSHLVTISSGQSAIFPKTSELKRWWGTSTCWAHHSYLDMYGESTLESLMSFHTNAIPAILQSGRHLRRLLFVTKMFLQMISWTSVILVSACPTMFESLTPRLFGQTTGLTQLWKWLVPYFSCFPSGEGHLDLIGSSFPKRGWV